MTRIAIISQTLVANLNNSLDYWGNVYEEQSQEELFERFCEAYQSMLDDIEAGNWDSLFVNNVINRFNHHLMAFQFAPHVSKL